MRRAIPQWRSTSRGQARLRASLVFGLSQSLDGYVDHLEMEPGPALFRHFTEWVRDLTGSVYGRRTLRHAAKSPPKGLQNSLSRRYAEVRLGTNCAPLCHGARGKRTSGFSSRRLEKLFDSVGMTAKLSGGGLITRQLISRVGGIQGARVFKIPGVRRLLKTFGPNAAFARNTALQLIGRKDAQNPAARFSDHEDLYIEARPIGTKLTPAMVFEYLVEKGLFRIGVELTCPTCRLSSWIALGTLRQVNVCELCGASFDGTRQLVNSEYHYRRSGVLGLEKNAQGAVPVALVLQQLTTNLDVASKRAGAA
jgi:hypothetical protein